MPCSIESAPGAKRELDAVGAVGVDRDLPAIGMRGLDQRLRLVLEHPRREAGAAVDAAGRRELDDVGAAVDLPAHDAAAGLDAVAEILRARQMGDQLVVERAAPVHVAAGGRDALRRVDDARALRPSRA